MTYDFRVAGRRGPAGHHANLLRTRPTASARPTAPCRTSSPRVCRREARPRRAVLRARVGRRGATGRPLPAGTAAASESTRRYAALAALAGKDGWTRELGRRRRRRRTSGTPESVFVSYEDPRVAAPQVPLRARARARRRDVLGVPRRPPGALLDTLDAALRGVDVVPLSGVWRFALDPKDEGLSSSWDGRSSPRGSGLPGVLQAQGFGDDVTRRHAVDGPDRRSFLLHGAAIRALPAARATSRCRSGCSRTSTTSAPAWYQRDVDDPAGLEGQTRRAAPRAAALGDARLAGRPARRLERQPLHAARIRPRHDARAGPTPADDPRGQPAGRGRRRQLPQRHRPHAGQLERHRRADRAAGDGAGLDRGRAGLSRTSQAQHGPRAGPIGNARGHAGRAVRCGSARRAVGQAGAARAQRSGRRSRGDADAAGTFEVEYAARRGRDAVGRVHARRSTG